MKYKIFVSSVQKEFKDERRTLRDYIHGDPLLRKFFEVFIFEDLPASDRRADDVYLEEVQSCNLYLGLFGNEYGIEDGEGKSPTHKEFLLATQLGKPRLIYVKGDGDSGRHPKTLELLRLAGDQLIRRRFNTQPDLHSAVYASLVQHLLGSGRIITGPFDATACRNAKISDISEDKIRWFLSRARRARNYAVEENAPVFDVLTHLDLLDNEKPIPSYQIYKGTVFDMVDQAVDFVMSKLNRFVGTRKHGPQAPVEYDIPEEVVTEGVVTEGIVNAVAHRDYTSNASVEVMLFADRLEIWNPGTLPPSLTIESLSKTHSSQPGNPLIAEPLFLTKYIEKAGTGTVDIFDNCRKAGLKLPQFRLENGFFILTVWRKHAKSQPESRPESQPESLGDRVQLLLNNRALSKSELSERLGQKEVSGQLNNVVRKLLGDKHIELTIPDKPKSRLQKYRLTEKGAEYLKKQGKR